MKLSLLLLVAFLTPMSLARDNYYNLSCEDFDDLLGGLQRSNLDAETEKDILDALIDFTDPKCFED